MSYISKLTSGVLVGFKIFILFFLVWLVWTRTFGNFASSNGTLVYRKKRFNHSLVHSIKGIMFPLFFISFNML